MYGPISTRKEFGLLLKTLRTSPGGPTEKLPRSDDPNYVTQEELAEAAGLDVGTIKNLEKGEIVKPFGKGAGLSESAIYAMARRLGLSRLEGKEFGDAYLLLSVARGGSDRVEPYRDALRAVERVMSSGLLPGFVLDEAAMLVMINNVLVTFEELVGVERKSILKRAELEPDPTLSHNIMSWVLDDAFHPMNSRLLPSPDAILREMILQFRYVSLTYRHTARLQRVLAQLWKYDRFRNLWNEISAQNRSGTPHTGSIDNFEMGMLGTGLGPNRSDLPENIAVQSKVHTHITDRGVLRVYTLEPMNRVTYDAFGALAQVGQGYQKLGGWPLFDPPQPDAG